MLGVLPRRPANGPLGAGLVAGGIVLVLPAALVELAVTGIGLTEILPGLGPPISLFGKLWLASAVGFEVAAIATGVDRLTKGFSNKEDRRMNWPKALGLRQLARIARGAGEEDAASPDATVRAAFPSASALDAPVDLERRRADLHPDAPPRPPLMASRDLPPLTLVDEVPAAPSAPAPRFTTAVRETSGAERPRPLPRAPEPLSAAEVEAIVSLAPAPMPEPAVVQPIEPVPSMVAPIAKASVATAPLAADAPLSALLARFEANVERRLADEGRVIVDSPEPEADSALREALDTLKRLSEQTRKAG